MMNWIVASFQDNLSNVISQGLPIMIAGMMGIFVVIGIIILTVALLAKVGGGDGYFAKGVKALFTKQK
jgi:hypothetical protein